MDRLRVGIVIPALNEAATISQVVRAASGYGTCFVVNDGSTDDTAERAAATGAVVVSHAVNRGYDAALNSGFHSASECGCDVIVTLDADGQHDPQRVQQLLDAIQAGAFVALGVRHQRARWAEHVFSWFTRWRWGIVDPLCGLKAYRTEVYRALGHFDACQSIGTELMLFAARQHLPIRQIPFTVSERLDQPRFGHRVSANWRILKALLGAILHGHPAERDAKC